jgi:hypothetical protein
MSLKAIRHWLMLLLIKWQSLIIYAKLIYSQRGKVLIFFSNFRREFGKRNFFGNFLVLLRIQVIVETSVYNFKIPEKVDTVEKILYLSNYGSKWKDFSESKSFEPFSLFPRSFEFYWRFFFKSFPAIFDF